MPSAVKLSDDLVQAARSESRIWSRSMTQQIEHWARIGRAVERSGVVSLERIRAALSAKLPYDELGAEERMVVLGQLERAVFRPQGDTELAEALRADAPVSGADADGRLFVMEKDGTITPLDDPADRDEARRRRR